MFCNRKHSTVLSFVRKAACAFFAFTVLFSLCSCTPAQKTAPYSVSDTPLELSIFMHAWNSNGFDDSYAVFAEAQRLTNVSLKSTVSGMTTNSQQAYDIMMASGHTADIIAYTSDEIEKSALDGAIIPLNELIDAYAPHIKAYLEQNKDILYAITSYDGNIYSIPKIMNGDVAKGWMIRKDWLDKLGLAVPQTVEQYYAVLKAFKTQDPNGNGRSDEIPFFTRDVNTATTELLSLFGVKTRWGLQNGRVTYGEYTPAYKEAMKSIAAWYQEGLIDREIFTRASNARETLFEQNIGGSTHDWFTSTMSFNTKMQGKVDGFSLAAIAPPADINGKGWEESSRAQLTGLGWAISATNEHPVETIKYFDFWFSEPGNRLINYGVEGVHYTLVDGKPVFKEELKSSNVPLPQLLSDYGIQINIGFVQDFAYEEQIMDTDTKAAVRMYQDNGYCMAQFPSLTLSPQEQKVYSTKLAAIEAYIRDTAQEWVLGGADIDAAFDGYIQTLHDMGMDEVLAAYQAAYDRYIAAP